MLKVSCKVFNKRETPCASIALCLRSTLLISPCVSPVYTYWTKWLDRWLYDRLYSSRPFGVGQAYLLYVDYLLYVECCYLLLYVDCCYLLYVDCYYLLNVDYLLEERGGDLMVLR